MLAVAPARGAAGLWSRYTSARAVSPDPALDPDGFVARLASLAERHGPMVLYPGREEAIDALLRGGALASPLISPWPSLPALRRLRDKRELPALAAEAGLVAPRTLAEGSARDLDIGALAFPCAVKPAYTAGVADARRVGSRAELSSLLATLPPSAAVVVQEWVEGDLAALSLVMTREGRLAARFQQRSLRIWPEPAGTSVVAVSVRPDAALVEAARRMLAGIGYGGLVQLQFVLSPTGPRLIDANPRFYGSLALALAAGLNLPAIWHATALERGPREPAPYAVGVNYHRLEGDLAATWRGAPGRRLRPPPSPRTGAIWAADDPLPSLIVAASTARRIVGRGLARAGGGRARGRSGATPPAAR